MEKSPEAFRTISEVAEDLDVPQHVLRFWESKFAHIRPMKRGGGRRYYRPGDIELLRGIRHLLYGEGFTIRGVQKILRERGAPFVVDCGKHGAVLDGPSEEKAEAPAKEPERPPAPQSETARPPAATHAAPATPAAGRNLSDDDIDTLRAALGDLQSARALLKGQDD